MFTNSYLKHSIVLLFAFLSTALFVTICYILLSLALPKTLVGFGTGALSAFGILFMIGCLYHFANRFLYDKGDNAELQILGGVRFGGVIASAFTGKAASWPFAKISASRDAVRLQSVFGEYTWSRMDSHFVLRKVGHSRWRIGSDNGRGASIIFIAMPWKNQIVDQELKKLGYEV